MFYFHSPPVNLNMCCVSWPNSPWIGLRLVCEISLVGYLEKPVTKSAVLSPVTRTVWGPVLLTRSLQFPGAGSLTLTMWTLLRLSSSVRPLFKPTLFPEMCNMKLQPILRFECLDNDMCNITLQRILGGKYSGSEMCVYEITINSRTWKFRSGNKMWNMKLQLLACEYSDNEMQNMKLLIQLGVVKVQFR